MSAVAAALLVALAPGAALHAGQAVIPKAPATPPIARMPLKTPAFDLALRSDTQTLAHLSPTGDGTFDFVPAGREAERAGDGYVHIGDIHVRLKRGTGPWQDFSSARAKRPITRLKVQGTALAAADITASMGTGMPLRIERRWGREGGALTLRFTLSNASGAPVEVGGLGLPMVFDNILLDRDLDRNHAQASFVDPYIGRDAGYLQVTRLNGAGPVLLVLPERGTPLEAYRPVLSAKDAPAGDIFTDRGPRTQMAEGFYDWTVASKGFAEKEWANAGEQWNVPTSFTLAPGERRTIGLRFVTAPEIRAIEDTLAAHRHPVAIGIPGYVLPTDQQASLFLRSPSAVTGFDSYPHGALSATPAGSGKGWSRYAVRARGWGQARLTVSYTNGDRQTISYFITKPLDQVMADVGRFSTTKQWFETKADPFGRSPGILTYDRDLNRVVTQDNRVWIAGLSDEGGAGAWVAAAIKQLDNPDPAEVAKLERFVDETILGGLQVSEGPHAGGVRKSLFYYDPTAFPRLYDPAVDWKLWSAWDRKEADSLARAYNYPHVAIAHWVLYRLARNSPGLVTRHDWRFYLDWAFRTSVAMEREDKKHSKFGLMEGDVFLDILTDLRREGMRTQAAALEAVMKSRVDHWRTLKYPFGSEMPWDSTGQPEVYAWMRHFGLGAAADLTREVILGYDPTVPSWGYNGNARRYWDFLYAGKVQRYERQIHHYGSTLNAVPLFDAYRANPADLHLLRVAYGGMMGGITNIDREGFGSAAFHAWPDMMRWDPITGDFGMGLYGHVIGAATYMVEDPRFGWLAFGGDLHAEEHRVRVVPRDGARRRLFVAPVGAWITLDAGRIAAAEYDPRTRSIRLTLDVATSDERLARMRIETTTKNGVGYVVAGATPDRGGYQAVLGHAPVVLTLTPVAG